MGDYLFRFNDEDVLTEQNNHLDYYDVNYRDSLIEKDVSKEYTGAREKVRIPDDREVEKNPFPKNRYAYCESSKAGGLKGKIIVCGCAVIVGIAMFASFFASNSSNKNNSSTQTATQETKYVTAVQLNELAYLKKDNKITVSNGNITSNTGMSYDGYITGDFPYSEITYALNGNYDSLTAIWAISEYGKNTDGYSSFEILADGTSIYESPRITSGDIPVSIDVDLGYCDSITIVFKEGKGEAFIGCPILSSSQSEREYSNTSPGKIKTSKWLTELEKIADDHIIVWNETVATTNIGTDLANSIVPYVGELNSDDIEFKKCGAYVDYYLGGEYSELTGTCAIIKQNGTIDGNMTIQILADGSTLYTSPLMSGTSAPSDFKITIEDCNKLTIRFEPSNNEGHWKYDAGAFGVGNLKLYQ